MDGLLDLMEDTEDDMEEMEQRFMGSMKQPHKYYIEQHEQRGSGSGGGQGQPRARSESPFAKGGRVRPEDFISVRRQRCGSSDTFTNLELRNNEKFLTNIYYDFFFNWQTEKKNT
jgi:hypothetical protein